MTDDLTEPQERAQGWGKTTTLAILEQMRKYRPRFQPRDYRPLVTEGELEYLKAGALPEMSDWWDENAVIIQPMSATFKFEVTADEKNNLLAMIKGENHDGKKRPPALNRADRRSLRHGKAR